MLCVALAALRGAQRLQGWRPPAGAAGAAHWRLHSGAAASQPGALALACLRDSRALIRVHGEQTLEFMQGILTNDMRTFEAQGAGPMYAALLSPKGKMVQDVVVYDEPAAGSGGAHSVLLEVDAAAKAATLRLLTMYKLKRRVSLADVSADHTVWAAFPRSPATGAAGASTVQDAAATAVPSMPPGALEGTWHADPRLPQHGWRGVFRTDGGASGSGRADDAGGASSSGVDDAYLRWRCRNGIAEGQGEMGADQSPPLEFNLDALNGISYTKGCYVGQERVSYSHYRGIIRRRCMPFRLEGPHGAVDASTVRQIDTGSDVRVAGRTTGPAVGKVRALASNGDGLALLRLSEAMAAEAGEVELVVVGGPEGLRVRPFRPSWWSPEWGREEEEQQQERGQQ